MRLVKVIGFKRGYSDSDAAICSTFECCAAAESTFVDLVWAILSLCIVFLVSADALLSLIAWRSSSLMRTPMKVLYSRSPRSPRVSLYSDRESRTCLAPTGLIGFAEISTL